MADRFIYVIGSKDGPNKIGMANDVERRLTAIQSGNERGLEVLYKRAVPADRAYRIERRAHWHVRDSHLKGEWFSVTGSSAIEAIEAAVLDGGNGPVMRAPGGIGRPPVGGQGVKSQSLLLRLSAPSHARIVAAVGKGQMGAFIREAIEAELRRRERGK